MIELVTGVGASPHVSSKDFGAMLAGIVGTGNYLFQTGSQFAYTINNVNSITISDGDGMMGGRHFTIAKGDSAVASIANGSQGSTRRDLICVKYTRESGGTESASIAVLKGSDGSSADPTVPAGNILNGDSSAYFPLYRVRLNGLAIEGVDRLFDTSPMLASLPTVKFGASAPNDNDGMPDGSIYIQLIEG